MSASSPFWRCTRADLLCSHEVHSLDQQCRRAYSQLQERPSALAKYTFLSSLRDQNIVLFYSLCLRYLETILPLVYTPTVKPIPSLSHRAHERSQ